MRTMLSRATAGLTIAICLLSVSPARAQDTFGDLARKIREGQQVIVIDQQGSRIHGRLQSLSSGTLVVQAGLPLTFRPADVKQVLKPDHMWDGAIKGAAFGVIPAVLVGVFECDECVPGAIAALFVGAGAGAGFAIDALVGPKTVFRGGSQPPRVSLAPILGRHRHGVAASLRF